MSTNADDRRPGIDYPARRVWISALCAMLGFVCLGVLIVASRNLGVTENESKSVAAEGTPDETSSDAESEAVAASQIPVSDVPRSRPTREATALQEDAMRRARVQQMQTQATRLREKMESLEEKRSEFVLEMGKVLVDEQGKRLAADVDLVDRFVAFRDKERPLEEEIASYRDELDILLEPVESINPSGDVSRDWVAQIDDVSERTRDAIREYDDDLRSLRGLIARGGSETPSPETLEVAVRERQDELAKARLDRIKVAAKEAHEAMTEELADEAAAEAKRKLEYERLRREALSPQVLSVLAPLITPDYSQPREITGGMATGERTAEKKPVSLSRLRSLGVLEQDERGMIKVALLNSWEWTRRPRWDIKYQAPEPGQWSPQLARMIRATQQYLIKYGDVLVAEGKLSP